jgi:hypothetical protein
MTIADWITQLAFGGFLGVLGQSIRVVPGLKKLNDVAHSQGAKFADLFEVSQFMLSLLIGFIAGAIAILTISDGAQMVTPTKEMIVSLMGAGYAGSDFIEGFVKKYLPGGGAATDTAKPGTGNAPGADTHDQPAVG